MLVRPSREVLKERSAPPPLWLKPTPPRPKLVPLTPWLKFAPSAAEAYGAIPTGARACSDAMSAGLKATKSDRQEADNRRPH